MGVVARMTPAVDSWNASSVLARSGATFKGSAADADAIDEAVEVLRNLAGIDLRDLVMELTAESVDRLRPALAQARGVLAFLHGISESLTKPGATVEEELMSLKLTAGKVLAAARDGAGGSSASGRTATILSAMQAYRVEVGGPKRVICSMKNWINDELRQKRLGLLTDDECRELGVSDDPRRTERQDRRATIVAARRGFEAEKRRGVVVLCNERVWVDGALRDAGAPLLTRDERAELGWLDPAVDSRQADGDDDDQDE